MRLPIPLETDYGSTRLSSDVQSTVNIYPHSVRGYRQYPGLDFFGQIQKSASPVKVGTFDATDQVGTLAEHLYMSKTGIHMYIGNTDTIYQYSMSTAFSIKTAVYTTKKLVYDFVVGAGNINDLQLSKDGFSAYLVYVLIPDTVFQVDLSIAFDISTGSFSSKSFSFSSEIAAQTKGLAFSDDGLRMFALAQT